MWGADDLIVPPAIGHQSRQILGEGVPLAMIPAAGHAPYLERPELFNDAVLAFLREKGLTAGALGAGTTALEEAR